MQKVVQLYPKHRRPIGKQEVDFLGWHLFLCQTWCPLNICSKWRYFQLRHNRLLYLSICTQYELKNSNLAHFNNITRQQKVRCSHTGNLYLSWFPTHLTESHVVPVLTLSFLTSTKQFYGEGCKVMFNKDEYMVYHNTKLILVDEWDLIGIWILPASASEPARTKATKPHDVQLLYHKKVPTHAANHAYQITAKQKLIQYLHQCAVSPMMHT